MTDNLLFEHFSTLATAPDGVARLRELILQLAVQGKLGTQDPGDAPASVLLEKIKKAKEKLVKVGKNKKDPTSAESDIDNYFGELPKGWVWSRLSEVGLINPRNFGVNDDEEVAFIPMNLIPAGYKNPVQQEIRKWGEIRAGFTHFADNDVVMAKITPCFQNGKSVVLRNLKTGVGAGTTELHVFRTINNLMNPEYVLLFLKSPKFLNTGIESMTGTAGQQRVPKEYFSETPFPLPPLTEQHRIVTKVDRLMALCDELEARQQQERAGCLRLGTASLAELQNAESPDEFERAWAQVCEAFEVIFDCPENVATLRQTILQLAVQGRLVKQEPGDEPASVLLERVRKEKEHLVKEGKIKKEKPLEKIKDTKINFQLPDSWIVTRLGAIAQYNAEIKVSANQVSDDDWILDLEDIEKDTSRILQKMRFGDRRSLSSKSRFKKGDVLYGKLRPYLNKVVVADDDGYCTTEIVPIRPYYKIVPKFLMYALKTPDFLSYVNSKTYGIKMPRLGTADALNTIIPLPPLAEQHRIVARVDALMALCDQLEARLKERAAVQGRFAAVVGNEVVGGVQ